MPRAPEGTERLAESIRRVPEGTALSSKEECPVHFPKALFFIRIPKCASTSFVELLRKLSTQTSKLVFLFNPSGAFNWAQSEMSLVARQIKSRMWPGKLVLYARHFYYVDFRSYNLDDYTYITIVRDPLTRFISSYLYYHFSSKRHIQSLLNPKHRNETLQTCVEYEHDGCTHNLMTKYFCGHMTFCKLGDSAALEQAKKNMRDQFAVVGIVEDMELSLRVFKAILPQYFLKLDPQRSGILPDLNRNEHSLDVGPDLREKILTANAADVELYEYAKELLYTKVQKCGLR